ncbi:hypothetical protein [Streptomyces blattellae]|uniref:hypothetical protein n=1 Tax=Streptomyces blattellae TaxID=2569855 RepID=UPI001E396674|nr:hypothetical protein [Streptomyces blattellae]
MTAAILNQEIRDQFNSMFAARTTYSPTWTTTGTAPAIGNGTLTGRHMKVGRMVTVVINLIAGSTTTFGTGNMSFSLPFAAVSSGIAEVGASQLLGTDRWVGGIVISSAASTVSPFVPISATNTRTDFITSTRPETLASGAQIRLSFVYEAAS